MSVFMKWLDSELEKITENDLVCPNFDLEDGFVVIGTIGDLETKKLFTLKNKLLQQTAEIRIYAEEAEAHQIIRGTNYDKDHDFATCEVCKIHREMELLNHKLKTVESIFWTAIIHDMSLEARCELQKDRSSEIALTREWEIAAYSQSGMILEVILI